MSVVQKAYREEIIHKVFIIPVLNKLSADISSVSLCSSANIALHHGFSNVKIIHFVVLRQFLPKFLLNKKKSTSANFEQRT